MIFPRTPVWLHMPLLQCASDNLYNIDSFDRDVDLCACWFEPACKAISVETKELRLLNKLYRQMSTEQFSVYTMA